MSTGRGNAADKAFTFNAKSGLPEGGSSALTVPAQTKTQPC